MTGYQLRTAPSQRARSHAVLLDWFPGSRAATVQSGGSLLDGLTAPEHALDLLNIAVAVYCADRLTPRAATPDAWSRSIDIHAPVSDRRAWSATSETLVRALDFLTGDRWRVTARARQPSPRQESLVPPGPEAVCLFSGGLDSLTGAIDLLDAGHDLVLVGHYEGGLAPKRQRELAAALATAYPGRVALRQFFLRPARAHQEQARPLPSTRENTTRGRSFLFLAAGFAVAAAISPSTPLYIPENGLIGINVPLTGSRTSSLSTRTTHPYFLHLLRQAMDAVGYRNPLENPYRLKTKGEMLAECRNQTVLGRLAPRSISCSHPEAARYARRPLGNCGYCYPCMIRRASMYAALHDDPRDYAYNIKAEELLIRGSSKGASFHALVRSLASPDRRTDVLRNGPVPNGEAAAFADVYLRGRRELRAWVKSQSSPWAKNKIL